MVLVHQLGITIITRASRFGSGVNRARDCADVIPEDPINSMYSNSLAVATSAYREAIVPIEGCRVARGRDVADGLLNTPVSCSASTFF